MRLFRTIATATALGAISIATPAFANSSEIEASVDADYDSYLKPLFKIAPKESVTLGTRAMIAAVLDLAPGG